MLDDSEVQRILVVTAHPDDVDFGSAGTIAGWTKAGVEVSYCICTDGDAGGFDPAVDRSEIGGIRRAEQTAAAAQVGVGDLHFLGYPDGSLVASHALRRDISRVIRQVRPQRMLISSPQRNFHRIYASHPDHLAAGEASMNAMYPDSRNPFAHPELLRDEGLEAWTVEETWLQAHPEANHYVDITDVFDRKIAALLSHVSQFERPEEIEPRVRDWNGSVAQAAGFGEGHLAEAFWVMPTG